jgi:hypothetical protein
MAERKVGIIPGLWLRFDATGEDLDIISVVRSGNGDERRPSTFYKLDKFLRWRP